jgi:2-phosphoglycerate kinase
MSLALEQGILGCISTDTVRAVMRSCAGSLCPALHRSSYAPASEHDDPVVSWKETCSALESSVEGLIDDAIARKKSIVLEGVNIAPSKKWLDKWEVCFVAVILYFVLERIAQFDCFCI